MVNITMRAITVKWKRLLVEETGQTCARCRSTEKELVTAVDVLKRCLAPLGIEVILEKTALDTAAFAKDVLESNRIWIAERPLEDWLEAEVGRSRCCEVCGNAECRTVETGEKIYESVPANLIIKAGLIAASKMVSIQLSNLPPSR